MDGANATLVDRLDLTADVATLHVLPDGDGDTYRPGQYATLGLAVAGTVVQRPYSMATPHGAGRAREFHVRRVHGGVLTERLWELPVGGRLRLGAPRGRFALDAKDDRPLLLVATGTGIAPFMAMIRGGLGAGRRRATVVLHGTGHADELGFADELRALDADRRSGVRYVPTISRPRDPRNAEWSGATGRAEAVLVDNWPLLGLDPTTAVAYLCGNPGMVAGARVALAARGFTAADIHAESYWLDREASPAA